MHINRREKQTTIVMNGGEGVGGWFKARGSILLP